MRKKITAPYVRSMKERGEKVVCVTAYDAVFGRIADRSGADLILVGDSAGNTLMGGTTTLNVGLDEMLIFTRATRAGVERALLVADLPFGTFQISPERAVEAAVALVKAGADAVKVEGAYVEAITAISRAGIPVMGHVGMTPQSINAFGGFRVQGKGDDGDRVLAEAKAIDDAGVFAIVLELVPSALSAAITKATQCPTIGIGAGVECDGQVQVLFDVLGLVESQFKHAKQYANGFDTFVESLSRYVSEVKAAEFPTEENSF